MSKSFVCRGNDAAAEVIAETNSGSAKKCCGCQKQRSIEEFYRKGTRLDAVCKTCILKKKKARYRSQQKTLEKPFTVVHANESNTRLVGASLGLLVLSVLKGVQNENK